MDGWTEERMTDGCLDGVIRDRWVGWETDGWDGQMFGWDDRWLMDGRMGWIDGQKIKWVTMYGRAPTFRTDKKKTKIIIPHHAKSRQSKSLTHRFI